MTRKQMIAAIDKLCGKTELLQRRIDSEKYYRVECMIAKAKTELLSALREAENTDGK